MPIACFLLNMQAFLLIVLVFFLIHLPFRCSQSPQTQLLPDMTKSFQKTFSIYKRELSWIRWLLYFTLLHHTTMEKAIGVSILVFVLILVVLGIFHASRIYGWMTSCVRWLYKQIRRGRDKFRGTRGDGNAGSTAVNWVSRAWGGRAQWLTVQ